MMNLEASSNFFVRMDKSMKAADFPDKYNEESIEAGVLIEVASGAASTNFVTMD